MAKLGTVWERTTEFAGERFGALAPLALVAFVVPNVASAWIQSLAAGTVPGMKLALLLPTLLLSVVSLAGSLAVMALATGERALAPAAGLAVRRLPAAILVSVLLGIVAAMAVAPPVLIMVARGYDVAAIAAGQGGTVVVDPQTSSMVALSLLVLIPLLLLVFTRLILVSPVVLREGVMLASIRRSWALTRKHGWRILGTLLLFVVIGGIAQLAARTVFGSIFTLLLGGDGASTAFVLTAIVTACVQAVVMVLLAAFQGTLYAALVDEAAAAA